MFSLSLHRFDPVPAIVVSCSLLLSVLMIWSYWSAASRLRASPRLAPRRIGPARATLRVKVFASVPIPL